MSIRSAVEKLLPGTLLVFALSTVTASVAFAQDAKQGESVYAAQKCQACHAIGGKGNKQNPLDGVGAKLSAAEIKEWIMNPTAMTAKIKSTKKPPMPNRYAKLPPADVDAMVAYLASLK
jgi:mono/diheme cytochrome c family protein